MGLGLSLNDDAKLEIVGPDHYLKISIKHGDSSPGETSITIPVHQIPSYISGLKVMAAALGLPMKAIWELEYMERVLNHEDFGRPVTPKRVTYNTQANGRT